MPREKIEFLLDSPRLSREMKEAMLDRLKKMERESSKDLIAATWNPECQVEVISRKNRKEDIRFSERAESFKGRIRIVDRETGESSQVCKGCKKRFKEIVLVGKWNERQSLKKGYLHIPGCEFIDRF